MNIKKRDTHQRVIAKRITSPETREDEQSGKRIALLSYIDNRSYQKHDPTTKELFLYAAGNNEEGERPDGLDRLADYQFIIHKNEKGKAIGLDVIPSRLYRSGVIPVSMDGVKTLVVQFDLDGAVARVTQRPFNTRAEQSAMVIAELDKLIRKGKSIHTGMRLGRVATVVGTTENSVEVRLAAGRRQVQGEVDELDDVDAIVEEDDVVEAEAETAATS